MKAADLRKLSVEDLKKNLEESRQELFNLRFKHATGQLEKVSEIPVGRRNIARILTILGQKGA